MEPAGSIVEGGEWNSFDGVYINEEADFMAQLFPDCSLTNEVGGVSGVGAGDTCWTGPESNYIMAGADVASKYSSDNANSSLYCFSQGSSYSSGSSSSSIYPTAGHENYFLSDVRQLLAVSNSSTSTDLFMADAKNNSLQLLPDNRLEGYDRLNPETSSGSLEESIADKAGSELAEVHLKTEYQVSKLDVASEDKNTDLSEIKKKRPCISDAYEGKRNVKSKKNRKFDSGDNNDEDNDDKATLNRQSSCNYSSEDDSSGLQEANGGDTSSLTSKRNSILNLNGKSRASRGSATDPQSLYARKRRERINERLKTLQNIVPNGTKVDMSTMLEEAVLYVKFLQLQIKFLSSDELWMYAPIAYNGMDIGLDL